jgi:hypothetical protein
MMARLGNVIYWIACGLAAIAFVLIVASPATPEDRPYGWIGAALITLVIWAIGRAIQYILGGGR